MLRRLILPAFALTAIGLAVPAHLAAREPDNLFLLKQEIKTYVDSGEYDREISRVATEATAWLEQRTAKGGAASSGAGRPSEAGQSKLAAVFDVDETLLSNLPHIRKMDFGYLAGPWNAWVDEGDAPAIAPVCDLFRTARRLGVTVFVLSGRREADRAGTERNLRAAGAGDFAMLSFKPDDSPESTEAFKTALRRKITADGYTIILNIGDQVSDLAGGYSERTFKLPNPFYITN